MCGPSHTLGRVLHINRYPINGVALERRQRPHHGSSISALLNENLAYFYPNNGGASL